MYTDGGLFPLKDKIAARLVTAAALSLGTGPISKSVPIRHLAIKTKKNTSKHTEVCL